MTMTNRQKNELKAILKGYRHITQEMLHLFSQYDLCVIFTRKHVKVRRQDGAFVPGVGSFVNMPSSPSDHRSGINCFSYIVRLIEA